MGGWVPIGFLGSGICLLSAQDLGFFLEERERTIWNSSMDGMGFHFASLAMWINTPKSILHIWLKNSTQAFFSNPSILF